ncbi:MAG: M15 family metallopeptidase [Coriobacteriales bacterium]|nr:M15 family metallopeptidase [Coriobacteriales bacterium]
MPQSSSNRRPSHARTRQRGQAPNRTRNAAASPARSRSSQPARYYRPPQRRSSKGPVIAIAIVVLLAVVIAAVLFLTQRKGKQDTSQTSTANQETTQQQTDTKAAANNTSTTKDDKDSKDAKTDDSTSSDIDKSSWELTLVNKTHPLPEDWDIELEEVYEGKYVDSRIAEQFKQMVEDCRAAGYDDVYVNQAYRSHEDQQAIWDEFYNQYLAEGYSEEEAEQLTGESVAIPGTSEHELGLAADICSINFDEEYNAPIQTWLRENGYKYGFIQRYPEGKEDITGTKNENWHFRYVGVEAATQIHDSGQVLEEYLGEVDSK